MDEEKSVQQMENAEERDAFDRDRMEDEFHEDEPAVMETEEEFRERESADMEADEEIRHHEPAARGVEEKIREREPSAMEKELLPLLNGSEAEEFRSRWQDIQTDFVDDPRHSVENADELVARVINSITKNFANERTSLEDQWNRGEEASTEDLRLAMKRYRSFFNRLLTLETSTVEE